MYQAQIGRSREVMMKSLLVVRLVCEACDGWRLLPLLPLLLFLSIVTSFRIKDPMLDFRMGLSFNVK